MYCLLVHTLSILVAMPSVLRKPITTGSRDYSLKVSDEYSYRLPYMSHAISERAIVLLAGC